MLSQRYGKQSEICFGLVGRREKALVSGGIDLTDSGRGYSVQRTAYRKLIDIAARVVQGNLDKWG